MGAADGGGRCVSAPPLRPPRWTPPSDAYRGRLGIYLACRCHLARVDPHVLAAGCVVARVYDAHVEAVSSEDRVVAVAVVGVEPVVAPTPVEDVGVVGECIGADDVGAAPPVDRVVDPVAAALEERVAAIRALARALAALFVDRKSHAGEQHSHQRHHAHDRPYLPHPWPL